MRRESVEHAWCDVLEQLMVEGRRCDGDGEKKLGVWSRVQGSAVACGHSL